MLSLVAIVLSGIALVLNIVGLAIPYWKYVSSEATGIKVSNYFGLWKVCYSADGQSLCSTFPETGSALRAVRAMELLGMLVMLAAVACLVLKQFMMKEQQMLPKVGCGCAFIGGLLMIVGTIIFATDSTLELPGADLHAGFFLCIVAGVSGISAGVLAILGAIKDG